MARRTQSVIFLSVFIFFTVSINSEQCIQKSPCSCEFEDGRKIDLKHLEEKDFLIAPVTINNGLNLTYYFHACSDKKLTFPNLKNLTNDCSAQTSLCLLNQTGNATAWNLGIASDVKFTFAPNKEKYLVFNDNKHNITTIIHMTCTPDYPDSDLYFKSIDSTAHNLILFSKEICTVYVKEAGLSTGSVLVILLFTFSAAYLLGGAAILHFLRGARGIEMVPNFEFWTGLPSLVRDGAVFLQNGCKPQVISTSESYDRI